MVIEMKFEVEIKTEGYETYLIYADSEEEVRKLWIAGPSKYFEMFEKQSHHDGSPIVTRLEE